MPFWTSFWLTNIHFAIMLAGTIINLIFVYVLFLAWRESKYPRLAIRALGFLIFAVFLASYAVGDIAGFSLDLWQKLLKMAGLLLIAISFLIDPVQPPPKSADTKMSPINKDQTKAPLVIAFLSGHIFCLFNLILFGLINLRIYLKYSKGLEKEFRNLLIGITVLFLAELAFFTGMFQGSSNVIISRITTDFGPVWIAYHIFSLIGFVFIAIYAWGYLRFKLVSQVMGAFIITSLFIYISVAFIYTSLLVRSMQKNFLENLRTNLQTFGYAVEQLKEKSLATTSLIASEKAIERALAGGDTEELSSLTQEQMVSSKVDFLAVVNSQGTVVARGEESEAVSDNLALNLVVKEALEGKSAVNIATREWVSTQQVLIESASPIATSGAVYSGHVIDNAFVDGLKETTGLDLTVYSGEVKSATTLTASDNVSRLTGIKQSSEVITKQVLEEGGVFLGLSSVFQNEYLSAFGPFKNIKGEILGMFFVGQPSAALFIAAQDSLMTAFYSIIILAVITFIPAYLLAKFIEKHQV